MAHKQVKVPDRPKSAVKENAKEQVGPDFDRPLGSSHNDKLDLRDVARNSGKSPNNSADSDFGTPPQHPSRRIRAVASATLVDRQSLPPRRIGLF